MLMIKYEMPHRRTISSGLWTENCGLTPDTASIAHWRSALIDGSSPPMLSLGTLSHDAIGGRMRLQLMTAAELFGVPDELVDHLQFGLAYHKVAVDSGKTYRFSANFTYSTYPFMAAYVVNALPGNTFYPLDGSYTVSSLAFEPWGEDTALYFTAPADTVVLQLAFLASAGYPVTVYVDDVLLEEVTYTHRVICLTAGELADRDGGDYRWSYTGGEGINEIYGKDIYVDLGERGVDVRLGRLNWRTDPLAFMFPYQSPYIYAGNSPIYMIDVEGLYGDESEATRQRDIAISQGLDAGEIYQSGDEWGFNVPNGENYYSAFNRDYSKTPAYSETEGGLLGFLLSGKKFDNADAPEGIKPRSPDFESEGYRRKNLPSLPTTLGLGYAATIKISSKVVNEFNKEISRIAEFNNTLKKPGVPHDPPNLLKVPKSARLLIRLGGPVISVWGARHIEQQYERGEINNLQYTTEQVSNAIGAIYGIGTLWTIGWEGGRLITNIPGYRRLTGTGGGSSDKAPECRICPYYEE